MINSYRLTFALVALFTIISASATWAVGSLDQEFEVNDGDGSSLTTSIRNQPGLESQGSQTFTVGLDGTLSAIQVYVSRVSSIGGPLILEIQSTTGGIPDGTVLASASKAPDSIPFSYSFIEFDITGDNLTVVAGQVLAIVLRADELPVNDVQWYNWEGENGANATYAAGQGSSWVNGGPWDNAGWDYDFGFRTYVQSTVSTQSATLDRIKAMYK